MNTQKQTRTELSELGEFGLIHRLTSGIKIHNSNTLKGVGDDAAVIENIDLLTLVSTDLLVEKVHFDLTYYPLKHMGYKASVVNFSDIYAMNGTPRQLLVGLAVSNRFSVEAIDEIYAGIRLACEKYHVDLAGGDTTSSHSGLFLSLTIIGSVEKNRVVYRNTANESDLICVSGDLGSAYAGLLLLEREKTVFKANPDMQPDFEGFDYVLGRQLKPEARRDIIELLKENEIIPTSMIDVSDGLASDILHLCNDSVKGCALYEEKIPLDMSTIKACDSFKIDPLTAAMNGGEDYELLFTIRQDDYEKLRKLEEVSIIGHITEASAGCNLITRSGQSVPITAQGWDGLKKFNRYNV
ncbi:MAG: thiamine-phosphate kinase [Bacteroidales bacterium]|jgi:thiamine-monophosphate kinase|nr:thiamine-phosphate kinase [Bacteroidales bacterium]MDD4214587.1 thiamine-phosphate kinase [Bacteroidales bacterium]